jgi:hypothetical protein
MSLRAFRLPKKGLGNQELMERQADHENPEIIGEGNHPHVPHPEEGEKMVSYYVNVYHSPIFGE